MIRLLLSIILITVAFLSYGGDFNIADVPEISAYNVSANEVHQPHYDDSFESDDNQSLPPRIQRGVIASAQFNIIRKRDYLHSNNIEFVKSGKIVNIAVSNFIQKEFAHIIFSPTEPTLLLIKFGTLII